MSVFKYNPKIYRNIIAMLYGKSRYIRDHNITEMDRLYYRRARECHWGMAIEAIRKTNFYFKHVRLR